MKKKIANNNDKKSDLIQFLVGLVVYAVVLMIAESLFKGIEVESFIYALIAAFVLDLLNSTVKPILIYWTLPLSILSFGIAYPIVNMIILKLCDILMGNAFNIHGFFATFFIAIFISFMRIILDNIITKNIGRR